MKKLITILLIFISAASYSQTVDTIKVYVKGGGKTDLSNYFTKGQIDSINAGYYTKSQVDSIVAAINATIHVNSSASITYTGDGSSGSPFVFSVDSVDASRISGGKIDTAHIPNTIITVFHQGAGYRIINGSGDTLYVKSIQAGSGVTITPNSDSSLTISSTATGTGGISKLGSPTFGLTKVNDSTYRLDTTVYATATNSGFLKNTDWSIFNNKIGDTSALHGQIVNLNSQQNTNTTDITSNTSAISANTTAIAGKLNISDTTNKWVQNSFINGTNDSLIVLKNAVRNAYKLPSGSGISKAYAPFVVSSGGDSLSQRFNVLKYGADPTGVSDSRNAIQNAINAATNAGGGTVFFPNGQYLIHGALVNGGGSGVGSPNSQLYVKTTSLTNSSTIKLLGESPPVPTFGIAITYNINRSGVILYSDITGSGSNPSILATDSSAAPYYFNYTNIEISNITFRVKANVSSNGPTMSALNLHLFATANPHDIICDIDTSLGQSVYPTAETFGIWMPDNNNDAFSPINNVSVAGYKYGYILPEHSTGNNINAFACEYGVVTTARPHGISFNRMGMYWCKYLLSSSVGTFTSSIYAHINVSQLDVEFIDTSYHTWFGSRYMIYDSVNLLRGEIKYNLVKSYVGSTKILTRLGADSLNLICMDNVNKGINVNFPNYKLDILSNSSSFDGVNVTNTALLGNGGYMASGIFGDTASLFVGNYYTSGSFLTANRSLILRSGYSTGIKTYPIIFSPGGTTSVTLFSNGHVGIGEAVDSLNGLLNVNGSIIAPTYYGSNASGSSMQLYGNTAFKNGYIKFGDSSAYDIANVRLGIGRVDPQAALDIRTPGSPTVIVNTLSANGSPNIRFQKSGVDKWLIYMDNNSNGTADFQIIDKVANKPRLYFNTSGDVYLGGTASSTSTAVIGFKANNSLTIQGTYVTTGTTTAQTINKPSGSVNLAAGATSVVVTNSICSATSSVMCTIQTHDGTATSVQAVPASGSFTIYLNAAATAETRVAWWIHDTN